MKNRNLNQTSQNEQLILRISQILRGCRKFLRLSQTTVAKRLGVDQSALSRIEKGTQVLTAPQWLEFCEFVKISPDSLRTGYVELNFGPSYSLPAQMKIPEKYLKLGKIKIRLLAPAFEYCRAKWGNQELEAIMDEMQVDPDFLIDMNSVVNFLFVGDFFRAFQKRSKVSMSLISELTDFARNSGSHGSLSFQYDRVQKDSFDLISTFVSNAAEYDQYFTYEVKRKSPKYVDILMTPSEHLTQLQCQNNSSLGSIYQEYHKFYLTSFTGYGQRDCLSVQSLESYFLGASRCHYRVHAQG